MSMSKHPFNFWIIKINGKKLSQQFKINLEKKKKKKTERSKTWETTYVFGNWVYVSVLLCFMFSIFFPCTWTVTSHGSLCREQKLLFITVHSIVHVLKNIKNGSHGTIHTFKNYFATVFSVFSFQFSVSTTISSIQTDPT